MEWLERFRFSVLAVPLGKGVLLSSAQFNIRGAESMVMKFHGNVRGEVRMNFLALLASKPHIFMCGALKLSGIVRANFRLNIAIPMLFLSLITERDRSGSSFGFCKTVSAVPVPLSAPQKNSSGGSAPGPP